MNAKDVIYLSYDGMTDPLGQSQVIPYLRGLSLMGYRFHLISFEKNDRFHKSGEKIKNILLEAGIQWYPLPYTKTPPVLSTLKDFRAMLAKAKEIMGRHEVALLHCRSYISALAGLEIKKRFNIPFVFDMRGFWADERIDGKIWNLSNPVYKFIYDFFKRKEKAFLQQSAHVVSLTENAKREILSWNLSGLSPGKITVIPCCADLGHFHPDRVDSALSRKLRNELNLPESCKILIYLGSLGTWYMSEEMMQFFSVLRKQDPDYLFLLVTRDSAEMLESLCRKYEIPPASIRVKSAERDEVPALIAMSTASVFFILPSYSKKASSPTKLAELMAMGIPVICNEGVGDVAEIIEKSNAGWAVSDFSAASLDTVAHKLINSEAIDRQKLRKAAEEYGSLEKGVMAYAGIYKSLLNP